MFKRIGELKPEIAQLYQNEGFDLKEEKGALFFYRGKESEVIDWRETTGPVTDKLLKTWLENFSDDCKVTLITMGYFPPKALDYYLKNKKLKERVTLIEMGLHNYFEETLNPSILTYREDFLPTGIKKVFALHGVELKEKSCSYCDKNLVSLCEECLSSLCKSHMLICPVCHRYFCHPDIENKRCFFEHRCEPQ